MVWAAQASQVVNQVNNAIEIIEKAEDETHEGKGKSEVTQDLKKAKESVNLSLAPYAQYLILHTLR